jgi:hypothetical protein
MRVLFPLTTMRPRTAAASGTFGPTWPGTWPAIRTARRPGGQAHDDAAGTVTVCAPTALQRGLQCMQRYGIRRKLAGARDDPVAGHDRLDRPTGLKTHTAPPMTVRHAARRHRDITPSLRANPPANTAKPIMAARPHDYWPTIDVSNIKVCASLVEVKERSGSARRRVKALSTREPGFMIFARAADDGVGRGDVSGFSRSL